MHKTVAIVDQEPELKDALSRLESLRKMGIQRETFLKKQLEDFANEQQALIKPIWEEITQFLLNKNRLPADYSQDKYSIHLDREDGTLAVCDGDHQDPAEVFKQFLSGMILK
jgi:hypothetical protein